MPVIDAHHHFWRYHASDLGWINDAMRVIRRDFLPADLEKEIRAAGVDGVVSVQARQSLEETRWLLELAGKHDFICGVVGWAPLIAPEAEKIIAELASNPKLRSLRHVLQGEPDERYMLRDDFNRGLAALRAHPRGSGAVRLGEIHAEPPGIVVLRTSMGGTRIVDMLVGDPLPRIC